MGVAWAGVRERMANHVAAPAGVCRPVGVRGGASAGSLERVGVCASNQGVPTIEIMASVGQGFLMPSSSRR